MLIKTLFSGFGGQGVMMMGYIMAHAAMLEEKHVTFMPSYGAEMRGGTANCTVAVSNEEIASPIASSPEYLVAMNGPSLARFESSMKTGGLVFLNSTMVTKPPQRKDIESIEVPASRIAEDMGDMRVTNIIMLGAFVAGSDILSPRTLGASIEEVFAGKKKAMIELNHAALRKGMDFIRTERPDCFRKKSKAAARA